MCGIPFESRRLTAFLEVLLALVLVASGGCGAEFASTSLPLPPTQHGVMAIPARTPMPPTAPAATPTSPLPPSPTLPGLRGRVVFVREQEFLSPEGYVRRVSNLWAINPGGDSVEQLTLDPLGLMLFYPSSSPPHILFASSISGTVSLGTSLVKEIALPGECWQRGSGGWCHCWAFRLSPDGRYLGYFRGQNSCGGYDLVVLDTQTARETVFGSAAFSFQWLADGRLLHGEMGGGCAGGWLWLFDPYAGESRRLGAGRVDGLVWSPMHTAFAGVEFAYSMGVSESVLWVYDVDRDLMVWEGEYVDGAIELPLCWSSIGSSLFYTRYVFDCEAEDDIDSCTFSPRQIWTLDRESGQEQMILGSERYDYRVAQYAGTCLWLGDWIKIEATPRSGEHSPEFLALNGRTRDVVPWEEAPVPTATPDPTIVPSPTPALGPDLLAGPICADRGGEFALYPGLGRVGLWRVPARGEPDLLVEDGHHFIYIP